MALIITEIAERFIKKLMEIFTDGEKSFGEIEEMALSECKSTAAEVVAAYIKCVDESIRNSKKSRKEAGYTVERRGDERRIQTLVGEVSFERTYYQKTTGGYEYLADTALGIQERERVSEGVSHALCEAAKGMSYQRASEQVESGAVSRQTVMNSLRKYEAEKEPAKEQQKIVELHIDADEDHVTMRGGKKSEVPLISVYEGIDNQGTRNMCKNIYHISEYGKKPDELWEQALTEAEARYDLTDAQIYLHGDGGAWIQTGLEWFPGAKFVLDKYHKNKAIRCMSTGLLDADRRLFNKRIRNALAIEDVEEFDQIAANLCDTLPERAEQILESAGYLKRFIAGISICAKDPKANNGGCTEPHVSHILSARLSSRPMAWSERTLTHFVPMLAGGKLRKCSGNPPCLPQPLQSASACARNNFRKGGLGLPNPDAIGSLPIQGKVTGTQILLKLFAA